jgi:hypothetical protein
MVMTDQRLGGNNQDREVAVYAAEAGMEKMTADMGNMFGAQGSLSAANIVTLASTPPNLQGITYLNPSGVSTYQISCPPVSPCTPTANNAQILAPSPYAGMWGLITPFTLTVAAQTLNGSEVKLQRQVQAVAIPVFQFGVFSETDLSFFNGPPFDFGGRVHTNGNLWLASNTGPLYLADRVTVSGQVIRSNLENGWPGGGATIPAGGSYSGAVNIALTPNPARPPYLAAQWRALDLTEGSVQGPNVYGAINPLLNNPTWTGTVVPAYSGMLVSGAPVLNLTTSTLGGITQPIMLIRRPIVGEAGSNPAEFSQQYFSPTQASLRILLDDYGTDGTCATSDMRALDSVSPTAPVDLATLANIPTSAGVAAGGNYSTVDGYWQSNGTPTITGCIKIEYVTAGGGATDVTAEILGLGYLGKNINPQIAGGFPTLLALPLSGTAIPPSACPDVSPNAVIRIARLRDNPSGWTAANQCGTGANGNDYWPNALFDTREAIPRTGLTPGQLTAMGVMYYVELDVKNLVRWFTGAIGASGANADGVGGYEVYFSDRRGNRIDPNGGTKTASLGFNDFVNPGSANACPNGGMDQGEDLESDAVLRMYGGAAQIGARAPADNPPPITNFLNPGLAVAGVLPNIQAGFCPGAPPLWGFYGVAQEARENPALFFRRALKIVNGGTINLGTTCFGAAPNPPCGLTIVSEDPVYIQGDYNAPGGNVDAAGTVAASVAADSVTLLSDNWNDINSFISPYNMNTGGRNAAQTGYRVALIAGKGIPFPQPAGEQADFGTDGGLHNFLRFLENWGGVNCFYEGSLVSFYYNRQGIGLYKTGNAVYSPPNRNYKFDTNFSLGPQWLPPRTPQLRSINTIGFTQNIMPTQ